MPNTLSDLMTNLSATPAIANRVVVQHGVLYTSRALVRVLGSHAIGHVYPLIRLPASARIVGIRYAFQDHGAGSAMHLGIYRAVNWSIEPDGVAVSTQIFANGLSLNANVNGQTFDPTWMQLGFGLPALGLGQLWNLASAPEPRPGTEYDICWTAAWEPALSVPPIITEFDYTVGT